MTEVLLITVLQFLWLECGHCLTVLRAQILHKYEILLALTLSLYSYNVKRSWWNLLHSMLWIKTYTSVNGSSQNKVGQKWWQQLHLLRVQCFLMWLSVHILDNKLWKVKARIAGRCLQSQQRDFRGSNCFSAQFPQANRIPGKQANIKKVRKFHDHETIRNKQWKAPVRSIRKVERLQVDQKANIAWVAQALRINLNISSIQNPMKLTKTLHNLPSTGWEGQWMDLRWHPYRLQFKHGLQPGDNYARWVAFCQWMVLRWHPFRLQFKHGLQPGDMWDG